MYTTYRIRADELNDDFLVALKTLFRDKTIEIAVSEAIDERKSQAPVVNSIETTRLAEPEENAAWAHLQPDK